MSRNEAKGERCKKRSWSCFSLEVFNITRSWMIMRERLLPITSYREKIERCACSHGVSGLQDASTDLHVAQNLAFLDHNLT